MVLYNGTFQHQMYLTLNCIYCRAQLWVPTPMPMGIGWAWVQYYYCSWVGMGSILLFMSEHGLKHSILEGVIEGALIQCFRG